VDVLDGHELRGLRIRDDAVGPAEVAPELDAAPALVRVEKPGVDEILEVVRDDDVGKARLVERGRAERAEEDLGAEAPEGRAIRRRELEKGLEEAVEAPARAEDLARLLDVETGAEPVQDGSLREERRDNGLGLRLDEKVNLVGEGPLEKGFQKVENEDARSAIAAVRRQGSEVDEDPQPPPL
jgi:hypothetical protein